MIEAAGKLSRKRDEMPTLVHQMSQPLTTLRCSLELSLTPVTSERQQKEYIEQAIRETDRAIALLEQLRIVLSSKDQENGKGTCK